MADGERCRDRAEWRRNDGWGRGRMEGGGDKIEGGGRKKHASTHVQRGDVDVQILRKLKEVLDLRRAA